ncbi:helix-turn-helix domain-containing protein [Actinomadura montaniterrae]|uniref:Helix-turn-helix transcriptional regulator n=1 Tax=Actinomadura montaniterrae TaxID=1803903 RepID=A0A6L3VTU1_9ACTN|nr:helix-turn-helix transcriptional regulator [Actinomadura montaniterrae]KAB2371384.1 helix-turn-helix transcriptional regulator [Actinomadura montaniterrae]
MGYDRQTYRRRKIGDSLRMFRESLGLTQTAACRLLDRSQASLSAYENGHRAIRPRDLKHILDVYGVTDALVRSRLLSLAAQGRQDGWWHDFDERLAPGVVDFASLEADALYICSFAPQVVHGLMQCDDYASVVIGGSGTALRRTPQEIETDIRFRLHRQKIHDLPQPPKIVIVLGEAALRQRMGGRRVMRDQMIKLLEMGGRAHIELQVLPFAVESHPGLDGAFTIMGVGPEGLLEVVTLHSMTRTWYVDEPSDVDHYRRTFDLLREIALPESDSRELIEQIVSEL